MKSDINFGLKIKQLIKKEKLTVEQFADKIGYSRQGINTVAGKEDVNTVVLKKICEAFDIDMDYFLTADNKMVNQEGNANMVGSGKISYKVSGQADLENKLNVLENENLHLKEQIKLLKEMIELLKPKPQ